MNLLAHAFGFDGIGQYKENGAAANAPVVDLN